VKFGVFCQCAGGLKEGRQVRLWCDELPRGLSRNSNASNGFKGFTIRSLLSWNVFGVVDRSIVS